MHPPQDSSNKNGQRCCSIELADRSDKNYILQCNTVIGVAMLLPFLGVSSLNFGPLARGPFFLGGLLWLCCMDRLVNVLSPPQAFA
jgi:hypothetical protein